jgi:Fe-S cluster assembly iron-binding protein IscA
LDVGMIKITEQAITEIKKMSQNPGEKSGGVLRLVAGHFGRLQFVKDHEEDFSRDQVITDEGRAVLLVDKELAVSLSGIVIDYQTNRGGLCLLRDECQDTV